MKALLLVGGKGTRLRPLTDRLPKPMVPVMGRPLLERTIENLRRHGVDEIILSTCYKSEAIETYFGDGADFGLKIHYVNEDTPLGTGGAIKNCEKYFNDSFFVMNADILSNINLSEMLRYHRRKNTDVTIAVTRVEDPSAYGVIEYDNDGYALSFREKPKEIVSHFINAGFYIFEPGVLKRIPSGRVVSVEREVFPSLLEDGRKIAVYKGCNYWLDIGTPEKYIQAHRDGFTERLRLPETDFGKRAVYSRLNASISRSAMLRGPVYLGRNVRIESGAVVGPHVVIGDNCVIGNQSKVSGSILWDNINIADSVKMTDCIVTNDCSVNNKSSYCYMIYTPDAVKRLRL
jgi:mannose-1-phosphate guanylyltransferase